MDPITNPYSPDRIPAEGVADNDEFIEELTTLIYHASDISIIRTLPDEVIEGVVHELIRHWKVESDSPDDDPFPSLAASLVCGILEEMVWHISANVCQRCQGVRIAVGDTCCAVCASKLLE